MRALVCIASLLLYSCASRVDIQAHAKQSEEYRVELMRKESEVYGEFFKHRIFHQDLMQSVRDTAFAPYPSLEKLFRAVVPLANEVVMQRIIYDTTYYKIKKLADTGEKKVKKTKEVLAILDEDALKRNTLKMHQTHTAEQYYALRKQYQDTCQSRGIMRFDPQQYAALIGEKIIFWNDSLEEVGRLIAREKADLKKRFPQQKGQEYFAAYRPISELEAMMKSMESMLAQLNNSLSRFEEGNHEDYIYFGPKVLVRVEVQVTDDQFGQISILMADCRAKSKEYWGK